LSRSSANENKINQFLTDDSNGHGHVEVNLQAEKIKSCGQNLNEMIESNNINTNFSYFDRKLDDNAYRIYNIEEKLNKHHQQLGNILNQDDLIKTDSTTRFLDNKIDEYAAHMRYVEERTNEFMERKINGIYDVLELLNSKIDNSFNSFNNKFR
jgi:hypothetical protein